MFKTASKFCFALSAFGLVGAVAYAMATNGHKVLSMDSLLGPLTFGYKGYVGEHVGYSLLMGLAVAAGFLGVFLSMLRDADPDAEAQSLGLDDVPAVEAPAASNPWPVVAGFSAGAIVLGLAIGPAMFVLGAIGLAVVTVEWAVRAWSDRATGDPAVNLSIRNRMMYPIEVPGLAVLCIGGLVLAVSRILLALPKTGSYLVFGLVPVAILAIGAWIVARPKLSPSIIAAILLFGGVALLGGGVVAAIAGERHHGGEEHIEEEDGATEEGLAPSPPLPHPSTVVIQVGP